MGGGRRRQGCMCCSCYACWCTLHTVHLYSMSAPALLTEHASRAAPLPTATAQIVSCHTALLMLMLMLLLLLRWPHRCLLTRWHWLCTSCCLTAGDASQPAGVHR
jgi:hypothetical protein